MAHIVPHLWFDTQAHEAAEFYTSLFQESAITQVNTISNTPSGEVETLTFTIMGHTFMAISAGPYFKLNPSISVTTVLEEDLIEPIWNRLAAHGNVLMPLDSYPFSSTYGWLQDRYGLSWQLMSNDTGRQNIDPITVSMLFCGENFLRAEEAVNHYLSIFDHAELNRMQKDGVNRVLFSSFILENQQFSVVDSGLVHDFAFNEAFSIMVECDSQEEIDHYFDKLSAEKDAEQCGWVKDAYGVSWQIVPRQMNELLQHGTQQQRDRVTQAMLKMKKINLSKLIDAYEDD